MPILTLIIILVVVGVLLWLISKYVPMDAPYKVMLNVAVLLLMLTFILETVGLVDKLPVLVALVVVWVGFLMWVVDTYIPMKAPFKVILQVVVVVALVWWILQTFGLLHSLDGLTTRRIGK
jgi:hypothetical protein